MYHIKFTFMNNRLQQFLTLENLTPARLADMLGIQRSGLSHILSGRNKPGHDFMLKLCLKFPHLNANWFITGKGKPYLDSNIPATNGLPETGTSTPPTAGLQNFGTAKNQAEDIYKNQQQINYRNNDLLKDNSDFNLISGPESKNLSQFEPDGLFPILESSGNISENEPYLTDIQENDVKKEAQYPHENRINEEKCTFTHKKKSVKRVIIFYNDGSFDELFPAKDLL